MGATMGFHRDDARRQLVEKRQHLLAPQRLV